MRTFRIVYMGTPDFAVPPLEALLDGPDEVVLVVTQPDRPKGRSGRPVPPPVKVVAERAGIEVMQPKTLRGEAGEALLAAIDEKKIDLGVVAAYGRILPRALLDRPAQGFVNVHASLLPRWRGASPIQWAIAAGDARTGISIMRMDEGLDTGPVIHTRTLDIRPDDTGGSLFERLAPLGAEALTEALDLMRRGEAQESPQDASKATYAEMLSRGDAALDLGEAADVLARRVRAFQPWPGAHLVLDGKRLKVLGAEALSAEDASAEETSTGAAPGTIIAAGAAGIDVATGHGILRLLVIQPEGKRPMSAAAFLAGHPLAPGTRLETR